MNPRFSLLTTVMAAFLFLNTPVHAQWSQAPVTPAIIALSPAEAADIAWMREEEKLAHDVYRALYDKWQLPVFERIAESESRHMAAMARLIVRYGLNDPVRSESGRFTHADLQALYDQFLTRGLRSVNDALAVGAEIEDRDLADLYASLEQTDKEDIRRVYSHLARASANHLRSFVRHLDRQGISYTPKYLSAAQYTEALNNDQRGGRRFRGQ